MSKNRKSKNTGSYTLTGSRCIAPVVKSLLKNIPLSIRSELTPKFFFKVLTSLSIQRLSIHSIQSLGSKIPCESSLRHHLKKINLKTLKKVNPLMFAEQIKPLTPIFISRLCSTKKSTVFSLKPDKEYCFFKKHVFIKCSTHGLSTIIQ
jgi:hypothetical protein